MRNSRKDVPFDKIQTLAPIYKWPFPDVKPETFVKDYQKAMTRVGKTKSSRPQTTSKPVTIEIARKVLRVVEEVVNEVGLKDRNKSCNNEKSSLLLTLELRKKLTKLYSIGISPEEWTAWVFFIVYYWGGIRSLSQSGFHTVSEQALDILKDPINKPIPFYRIASLSKVLAFFNPKDFFIFDSRVGLNLAFLQRKLTRQKAQLKFRIPPGRSNRAKEFSNNNKKEGIRLSYSDKPDETYRNYCQALKDVAIALKLSEEEYQLVETCLFSLEDKEENAWNQVEIPKGAKFDKAKFDEDFIAYAIEQTFFKK